MRPKGAKDIRQLDIVVVGVKTGFTSIKTANRGAKVSDHPKRLTFLRNEPTLTEFRV